MADQPKAAPQGDGNAQAAGNSEGETSTPGAGNAQGGGSAQEAGTAQAPGFAIDRIYVKDLSVENPGAPQSFQLNEAPAVEIGLRTRGEQVAQDVYECVLTITVTATAAGKTVFLVEASQAGLFVIRGVPASDMQPVLAIACPNVLFPYARETIADAITRTGFPPVHLAPINFETLYQQQLAQMQQPVPAVTN
jgi:preprotein translocase subunit SecB